MFALGHIGRSFSFGSHTWEFLMRGGCDLAFVQLHEEAAKNLFKTQTESSLLVDSTPNYYATSKRDGFPTLNQLTETAKPKYEFCESL